MIRRLNMRKGCEGESKEDTLHTIMFTAGTAVLMVCLKRFLVEQWLAWVFLLLNLILLAILLMSVRPSCWTKSSGSEGNDEEIKEGEECYQEQHWTSEQQEETKAEEEELPRLSKQELNERVEAFIAMFRQHLASDAKQAQTFSFLRHHT